MGDAELQSRILHLQKALRKLRELRQHSFDEFSTNYLVSDTALHNLRLVIEALTDIGNYLLKRKSDIIPETRTEVFKALCSIGVLDKPMEQDLIRMAKFRNFLVHTYDQIDLQLVHQILHDKLTFLESVAATLVKHIEKRV